MALFCPIYSFVTQWGQINLTVIIEFKCLSVNLIDDYCAKSIVLQIESIFRVGTLKNQGLQNVKFFKGLKQTLISQLKAM